MSVSDVLGQTGHRPWPMPRAPWVMRMTWRDLLFAHWSVKADALRGIVPAALELETFEGSAWLGVAPFVMTDVRPRLWPGMFAWSFCELNVRTYVTAGGKPGVYFFSLDAASFAAVRAARGLWGLPYYDAKMAHRRAGDDWITYTSRRTHADAPAARFAARYRPVGEARPAAAGSFEQFAMERYCLYVVDEKGRPVRGEIHHAPWRLRRAEATFEQMRMTEQMGVVLPTVAPRLHFADAMTVVAWSPRRAG